MITFSQRTAFIFSQPTSSLSHHIAWYLSEPQQFSGREAGTLVDFFWSRSTANYCRKRLFVIEWSHMPQSQGLVSSIEGTIFSRPPGDQIKHGVQIRVDRV